MANNKKQARPIFTTFSDISQPDLNGQVVGANEVSTNNIVTGQQPSVYKFTINGQDFDIASKDLNKYKTEIMNHIQNQSGVSSLGLSKLSKHVDDLFSALTQNVGDGRLNITLDPTGQIFTINGTDYGRVSNMERNYFGGLSARDLIGNFNKNFSSRLQGISPTGRTVTKTTSSFTPAALQKPASTTENEEGFDFLGTLAKNAAMSGGWDKDVWHGLDEATRLRALNYTLGTSFKNHKDYEQWAKINPNYKDKLTFSTLDESKPVVQTIDATNWKDLYEAIASTTPTTGINPAWKDTLTSYGENIDNLNSIDQNSELSKIADYYIDKGDGIVKLFKKNSDGTLSLFQVTDPDSYVQYFSSYMDPYYRQALMPSSIKDSFILTDDASKLKNPRDIQKYTGKVGVENLNDRIKYYRENFHSPYTGAGYTQVADITMPFIFNNNVKHVFLQGDSKSPIKSRFGYPEISSKNLEQSAVVVTKDGQQLSGWMRYNPDNYRWELLDREGNVLVDLGIPTNEKVPSYQTPIIDMPWYSSYAPSQNPGTVESTMEKLDTALTKGDNQAIKNNLSRLRALIQSENFKPEHFGKYASILKKLEIWYNNQQQVAAHKYGGILKMQFGGLAALYEEEKQRNPQTTSTVEVKPYQRQGTLFRPESKADSVRNWALMGDVASLSGGAVGVIGSLGSAAANTYADIIDDNVSRKEAWINLAVNLGFVALSALPGLAALKVAKGASKVSKSAKDAVEVLKKIDKVSNTTEASSRFNKLEKFLQKGTKETTEVITEQQAKNAAKELVELNNKLGGELFGDQTLKVNNTLYKLMNAEESVNKVRRLGTVNRVLGYTGSGIAVANGLSSTANIVDAAINKDLDKVSVDDARGFLYGIGGIRGIGRLATNDYNFRKFRGKVSEPSVKQASSNKVKFKDVENVSIDVEGTPTSEKVKSAIDTKIANINQEISTKQAAGEDVTALQNQVSELTKAKDSFTESSFKDKVEWSGFAEAKNNIKDRVSGTFDKLQNFFGNNEVITDQTIPFPQRYTLIKHKEILPNTWWDEKLWKYGQTNWFNPGWWTTTMKYKQGGKVKKYEQGDATTSGVNPEEQVKKEKGSSRTIEEKTLTDVLLENLEDQELIGFGNPRKLAFDIEPIGSIISHGIAALGNKKALKTLMDYEVPYVQAPEISLPVKVNTALENASKERARQLLNPHFHNLTSDASRNQAAYLDTQRQISENTRQVDAQIAQDLNQQRDKAVAQEYVNRKAQIEADNTNRAHAVAKANAKNQILAAYQKQQADNAEQLNRDIFSWAGRRIDQLNEANYLKGLHELAQKYQNPISDATAWANSAEVYESSNVAQSLATAGIDGDTPITADIIPENAKEQDVYPGGPKWKDVVGLTGKQLWLAEKNVAQRNLRNLMGQYSTDKVSLTADKTRYEHMIGLPLYQKNGGSMTAQAQIYNTDRRMELAYKKLMADQEKYYNGLAYKKNRNSMAGLLRAFLQEDKHAFKK